MALNFQQPNDPGEEVLARWSSGLAGIFGAYQASKQNAQDRPLRDAQLAAAQQQVAQGQRQAATADIQETAQFGAPLFGG